MSGVKRIECTRCGGDPRGCIHCHWRGWNWDWPSRCWVCGPDGIADHIQMERRGALAVLRCSRCGAEVSEDARVIERTYNPAGKYEPLDGAYLPEELTDRLIAEWDRRLREGSP